jgi:hypothetical protein
MIMKFAPTKIFSTGLVVSKIFVKKFVYYQFSLFRLKTKTLFGIFTIICIIYKIANTL